MSGSTLSALTLSCRRRTGHGWSDASGRPFGLTRQRSGCGADSSRDWTVQSPARHRTRRARWGSSWRWYTCTTPGSYPGNGLGTHLAGTAAPDVAGCVSFAARRGVPDAFCASADRTAAGAGVLHSGRMRVAGVTPAKSWSAEQSRRGSPQGTFIRSMGSSRGGLWRPLHGRVRGQELSSHGQLARSAPAATGRMCPLARDCRVSGPPAARAPVNPGGTIRVPCGGTLACEGTVAFFETLHL